MSNVNNQRRVRRSAPTAGIKEPPKQNERLVGRVAPSAKSSPVAKPTVPKKSSDIKDTSNRPKSAVNNRKSYSPQNNQKSSAPTKPAQPVVGRSRVQSAASKFNSPISNATNTRARSSSDIQAKPSSRKSADTKVNSNHSKPKTNVQLQSVSYSPNKDSVELPNITQKPPIPTKAKSAANKANGVARVKAKEAPKSPVTAVVKPVQSMTTKPIKLGHNFQPHELTDWVTWCDACGSMILSIGLFGKCVSCKKCKMVCHLKCAETVSLTCEADEERSLKADSKVNEAWYKTIVQETKDESTLKEYNTIKRVIPKDELKTRIEEFNTTVKGTQQMTLLEDNETFRGFIRVQINLSRPVSVQENTKTLNSKDKLKRSSSFYIDKGAVKALYLTSSHTSEQVIEALLNKYSIRDNAHKFALFEKQVKDGEHIILRKMLSTERPLFLRLLWRDGNTQERAFILQENETREIQWESFSPAELNTFLKIITKEEDDHRKNIQERYEKYRDILTKAIQYQKNHRK